MWKIHMHFLRKKRCTLLIIRPVGCENEPLKCRGGAAGCFSWFHHWTHWASWNRLLGPPHGLYGKPKSISHDSTGPWAEGWELSQGFCQFSFSQSTGRDLYHGLLLDEEERAEGKWVMSPWCPRCFTGITSLQINDLKKRAGRLKLLTLEL